MERQAKYFVVCCFIALSIAGLLLFNTWISSTNTRETSSDYPILFRGAVSGLSVGSNVRYLGVTIGRVTDINISAKHPGHVDVVFTSDQAIPVVDLVAQLEPQGITGLSIIELRLKKPDSKDFTTEAHIIPGYPSIISRISGNASSLSSSASRIIQKIDTLLTAEKLANLSNTLTQLDSTTANLSAASHNTITLMASLERASATLEKTLVSYQNVGDHLQHKLLPSVEKTALQLNQASQSASAILKDNQQNIQRLFEQDIPNIVGLSDELAQSLRGINELTNGINNNPSQLLLGKQLPELEVQP